MSHRPPPQAVPPPGGEHHLPGSAAPADPAAAHAAPLPGNTPSDQSARLLGLAERVAASLAQPAQADSVFRAVCHGIAAVLEVESTAVCTLEPSENALCVRRATGLLASAEGEWLPLEGTLAGLAVQRGEPQVAVDYLSDARAYLPHERGVVVGPMAVVGLSTGRQVLGAALIARPPGGRAFDAAEVGRLLEAARVCAPALETVRRFDQARQSRARMEAWRREAELRRWVARHEDADRAARRVVFEWDRASDRLTWGASLDTLLGHSASEFAATLASWLDGVHPADRDRLARGIDEVGPDEPLRIGVRLRHRSGMYRRFILQMGGPAASPGLVIGSLQESTARGEDREQARAAEEWAPDPTMTRVLRHEINNPLGVIMAEGQLLLREPSVKEDATLSASVDRILEEGARIRDFTERLITSGRVDATFPGAEHLSPDQSRQGAGSD